MYMQKPPVSKRELLNRLLSDDFDGDFRNLGPGAKVERISASALEIRFNDRKFILSAHIPRADEPDDFAVPLPPSTRRAGRRQ